MLFFLYQIDLMILMRRSETLNLIRNSEATFARHVTTMRAQLHKVLHAVCHNSSVRQVRASLQWRQTLIELFDSCWPPCRCRALETRAGFTGRR